MKIVVPGKERPNTMVNGHCRPCGCMFEFDSATEAEMIDNGKGGNFWRVVCPHCNEVMTQEVGR